jgi:hypothetical protein
MDLDEMRRRIKLERAVRRWGRRAGLTGPLRRRFDAMVSSGFQLEVWLNIRLDFERSWPRTQRALARGRADVERRLRRLAALDPQLARRCEAALASPTLELARACIKLGQRPATAARRVQVTGAGLTSRAKSLQMRARMERHALGQEAKMHSTIDRFGREWDAQWPRVCAELVATQALTAAARRMFR